MREGVTRGAHHRSSSFIIITHRSLSRTGDHWRQSASISERHRPVAPSACASVRRGVRSSSPSSSLIRTADAIPRISAAVPSPGIETTHRSMAIIMGRTRRAVAVAPSRRLLVADRWCLAASCSRP